MADAGRTQVFISVPFEDMASEITRKKGKKIWVLTFNVCHGFVDDLVRGDSMSLVNYYFWCFDNAMLNISQVSAGSRTVLAIGPGTLFFLFFP